MKTFVQITLGIAVLVFGYVLYNISQNPASFGKELELREEKLSKTVEDIIFIEKLYKNTKGNYTDTIEHLISFYNSNFIVPLKRDSLTYWGRTVTFTDSIYIPVKDSINKLTKTFDINNLGKIYSTNNLIELEIVGGSIKHRLLIKAHNNKILEGLDSKLIEKHNNVLIKEQKFPGIKVEI